MNNLISIQIKAAFLLLIFALKSVVGFACAIGVDMGFNSRHHHPQPAAAVHVHADGKKHHHPEKSAAHHHEKTRKGEKGKGGCCNDTVTKFSQTDKSLPNLASIVSPVFFTAFITSFYIADIFYASQAKTSTKYFVFGHHPPIPDIRIAIQSFQI